MVKNITSGSLSMTTKMLHNTDKMVVAKLFSPHKCEFVYQREDGTHYVQKRLGTEEYWELLPNPTGETQFIYGEKIK